MTGPRTVFLIIGSDGQPRGGPIAAPADVAGYAAAGKLARECASSADDDYPEGRPHRVETYLAARSPEADRPSRADEERTRQILDRVDAMRAAEPPAVSRLDGPAIGADAVRALTGGAR